MEEEKIDCALLVDFKDLFACSVESMIKIVASDAIVIFFIDFNGSENNVAYVLSLSCILIKF